MFVTTIVNGWHNADLSPTSPWFLKTGRPRKFIHKVGSATTYVDIQQFPNTSVCKRVYSPHRRNLSYATPKLPSARRWEYPSSLPISYDSNRAVSAWFVWCLTGEVANARPVETSVEVLLVDAARLRFSRIRQQTILCTTRVEAAMSPLY